MLKLFHKHLGRGNLGMLHFFKKYMSAWWGLYDSLPRPGNGLETGANINGS